MIHPKTERQVLPEIRFLAITLPIDTVQFCSKEARETRTLKVIDTHLLKEEQSSWFDLRGQSQEESSFVAHLVPNASLLLTIHRGLGRENDCDQIEWASRLSSGDTEANPDRYSHTISQHPTVFEEALRDISRSGLVWLRVVCLPAFLYLIEDKDGDQ